MENRNMEALAKILRFCLQITFAAGFIVTAVLWLILKEWFGWYFVSDARYYAACVALLTPCGVCSLFILWRLVALLKTVGSRNPFIRTNVRGMRQIAVCAFIISALFAALMCFRPTLLTAVIAYIFLLGGFCFIVFAWLFGKAVEYKRESDLTI